MKTNEVPQDESNLASANFRELCYAVDKDGKYTTKHSTGWNPKTVALEKSLEFLDERILECKERVLKNEISPVVYYMELKRMDLNVLSDYMGKWKWVVKRHFKPNIFKKLSTKTLHKYASTFGISMKKLKDITK